MRRGACWRFELQVLTLARRRCWEDGVVRDVMGERCRGATSPYWHAGMLMCENVDMLIHRRLHADITL